MWLLLECRVLSARGPKWDRHPQPWQRLHQEHRISESDNMTCYQKLVSLTFFTPLAPSRSWSSNSCHHHHRKLDQTLRKMKQVETHIVIWLATISLCGSKK